MKFVREASNNAFILSRPATLLKSVSIAGVNFCEFCKNFQNSCFYRHVSVTESESLDSKIFSDQLSYLRDFELVMICKSLKSPLDARRKLNSGRLMYVLLYNSTDNFLSPIPVFDWLIFCCGNSILHQKKEKKEKETKTIKTQFIFGEKAKKVYINIK